MACDRKSFHILHSALDRIIALIYYQKQENEEENVFSLLKVQTTPKNQASISTLFVFKMLSKNIVFDLFVCVCIVVYHCNTEKGFCQGIISLILDFQAIIWFPKKNELCFYPVAAFLQPLQKYWKLICFSIASGTR